MKSLLVVLLTLTTQAWSGSYANYTVPVPERLAAFAKFELKNARVLPETLPEGEFVVVSYDLPAELVGPIHPPIILSGKKHPGGVLILEGEFGEASCFKREEKTECIVRYEDLDIDPAAIEAFLKSTIRDAKELAARIEVSRIFGGEPIGVVDIADEQSATSY